MRIHSVELYNVKSYEHARVQFTEGVNAIVGHNGAGKSTLLEAIGFALFDSLEYTQPKFVRQGSKDGRIAVAFESHADGRIYEVVRKIGSGAGHEVHDPELGVMLCSGAADVPRFLREHMGIAAGADMKQLFEDALGVAQGKLTAIFLESPSVRKSAFNPLLRVEEYHKAFTALLEPKNLLGRRIGEVDVEIARLEGMLVNLPVLAARASELERDRAQTARDLAAACTALEAVAAERVRLEGQRQIVQAAEQAREHALRERAARQAQAEMAQRLLAEAEKARAIVALHQAAHDAYVAAQHSKQEMDARLRARQALELERAGLESRAAQARARIADADVGLAEVAAATTALAALEPKVREQETLEARRVEQQKRAAELKVARQEHERIRKALADETARLAEMRARCAELSQVDAAIAEALATADALGADREILDKQHTEVRARGLYYKSRDEEIEGLAGLEFCPTCEQPLQPGHLDHLHQRNEQERAALREQLKAINARLAEVQALLTANEERKRAAEARRRLLPDQSAVDALAKHVAEYEAQRDAAARRLEELADADDLLAETEQALRQLGNPRQERERLAAAVARGDALRTARDAAGQEAAEAARALADLEKSLAAFVGLDEAIQAANAVLSQNLGAYRAVLANQQTAATCAQRAADAEAAQEAVAGAERALAAAEAQVMQATANFDAVAYQAAATEESRRRGEVGGLEKQVEMLAAEHAKVTADLETLRAQEALLGDARKRRAALAHQESVLDKMRNVIKNAGPPITRAVIGQVSEQAAQIFAELTGDFTRRLRWNEDYGITLEVDGRARDFANLSGGEQMVAALAVRLALLREMSSIDIAFFDEPTAHLDAQRREALASQILAVKGFRQIFVISHDDTFERATHNLIHVERVDGASRIVNN